MGGFAEYELIEDDDGATVLVLSGPYLVSTIGAIDQDLRVLDGPIGTIDLSAISEIDTVGAWVACSLSKTHDAEIVGASDRAKRLVGALEGMSVEEDITAPRLPVWERAIGGLEMPWVSGKSLFVVSIDGRLYAPVSYTHLTLPTKRIV